MKLHSFNIRGSGQWAWLLMATAILLFGSARNFAADAPTLPPLTTVPGSPQLPGKFVWADLVTDDVPTAQKFYTQLFGWRFWDIGNYSIGANDERPLCGMFHRPRPADANAKPRWIGYISVANVEQAQEAVTKAGGKVLATPQKLPKRGEQAVFADPEGVVFGVIKSSAGDMEDFLPGPGDWIWVQLFSRDARQAAEFYRAVGGYEIVENTSSNKLSDYLLVSIGYARATVRTIRSDDARIRPNWLPFVRVTKISEAVTKTKQLGGKVLIEPKPELLDGKAALIADPTGAAIGIMEWPEPFEKGAQKP